MSLRVNLFLADFVFIVCFAHGALKVNITRGPEGDPAGVYPAATPVTLTCNHDGSPSANYLWTCSGEYNCFTEGLTQASKRRGILRGGDTGTHTCTVNDGGTSGTASTNITVTGIGFSYKGLSGSKFRYIANNSAIFIPASDNNANTYTLAELECASGTTSNSTEQLLFITPTQYQSSLKDGLVLEPGHWKLETVAGNQFDLPSFSGGVFTCRMPDENEVISDTSVGIYPVIYNKSSLSVSLSYTQSNVTLSLNCTSTGLPPTNVTWSKDGVEMSNEDTYTFSQRVIGIDNTVYENMVVITKQSACDSQGLYQCLVQCRDDFDVLVSSANNSADVTVPPGCAVTVSPSSTSTSSPKTSVIISNSSMPFTAVSTSFFGSTSIKQLLPTTQSSTETTETQATSMTTEIPTDGQPLSDEVLYAIVAAAGAAVVISLVVCFIVCCCVCVTRRSKRKGDRKNASEMQQFGQTPSEKAMAETLMNVTKEISPEDAESVPLVENEELLAVPSSTLLSIADHKYEDLEPNKNHEYEEVKVSGHDGYEDVQTVMVRDEVQEENQSEGRPKKESEEGEERNEEKPEKENWKKAEKESEEEKSDVADLEVTAIDVDDDVPEEDKQEAKYENEEYGKQANEESGPRSGERSLEVDMEPPPPQVAVEAEIGAGTTPVPSSTHSLVGTTVDEAISEQSLKGEPGEIPLVKFGEHVRKLHENNNELFLKEYESFPMKMTKPHEAGISERNVNKNRFKDIVAYDHSRVLLKEGLGIVGTDYINANYLHGWQKENMYIAAQGPTSKTIADFWRMIWEHKLSTIVMLTRCVEGGKTKCQQYWPNNLKMTALYDSGVRVTLDNITSFAEYEYRKMTVKSSLEPDAPPLKVTHFQYTVWPDHGVPQQSNSLMAFIRRVRVSHPTSSSAPLLVHCSAGVGRSGTFIALDSLMLQVKDLSTMNVHGFVKGMREQRTQMVQTDAQYIFIHDALNEIIKFGDTSIASSQLPSLVMSFEDDKTELNKQFQMLVECSPAVDKNNCSEGLLPANADKNRTSSIVPFNTNRVVLRSANWKEQQYINASFLDNYSQRMGFVATQTPMPNTVKDFWQMVWNFPCRVVVTLNEEEEKFLVMEQGVEVEVGQTTVVLQVEEEEDGYTKRVYSISNSMVATGHSEKKLTVTQFQLRSLPTMVAGASTAFLDMIDSVLKIQMATGNKPITVMCPDGSGCSGVFMVVYSQLEKLKVEGLVDVFQCVKTMRTKRARIVADVEQYQLCFHILADYLSSVETYSNFQPFTTVM